MHARDLNLHGAANRTEWQHNGIGLNFPADTPPLWSYCNSQELKCQVVFGSEIKIPVYVQFIVFKLRAQFSAGLSI